MDGIMKLLEDILFGDLGIGEIFDYIDSYISLDDYYGIEKSAFEDEGYGYTCTLCGHEYETTDSSLTEEEAIAEARAHLEDDHLWDIVKHELDKYYRKSTEQDQLTLYAKRGDR